MTALKDRILILVKDNAKVHVSSLLSMTTEDGDVIRDDVIKESIASLLAEGRIDAFPMNHPYCKGDIGYRMPDSFYRTEIIWGWESHLKFICPWDETEKVFSSGDWVYNSWRRNPGDEMRWVAEPIPQEKRDGMRIQRQWRNNNYWRYSLIAWDGSAYTLNDCD
jgi:hypothetical protein